MKNFLQVNRALRAKKNFNFNFKHLLVLGIALITCINTAWGADFTAAQIAEGASSSNISVSTSGLSNNQSKNVCSGTKANSVSVNSSAGATYSSKYIEIQASSGYTISTLSLLARSNGDASCVGAVVFWNGTASATCNSYNTFTAPANNSADCSGTVSITVPAGTRTVRIYRAPQINSSTKAFTSGDAIGGTSTFNIFSISATATASAPSTSADTPGASGTVTFTSWTSLSTGTCYWKDGIKCFQYSSGGLNADAPNFTSKVDFGYMSPTAGSGWGSYNMSGLVTYAHFALGVSITTPSVVEVVVDNNQSNDLTLARLFIKKDDVSYGTGYGSGNYTSGTDIKSRATITRVTDNTGRYKISIPVSASDLATTSPYIIKFYSNSWTNPIGFVFESVTVKPVYTVTYNANGKDGGGAAPTDGSSPYVSGSNVTVLGNTNSMTKTDCVFNGWNTRSDGTGTHYDVGAVISSISENITLYAEWVGYATSWNWWESGQKNDGTTFTYLTNKNYLCSFKSSGDKAVASWDISGGEVYRGVKIKTKDHSMAFWVPSGKRVSITFGYMSTKPAFTVGGVNKAGDLSTSTTDSATVTYTTSADTKFYIENETSTGTAFTIKSVQIENSCTAPTSVSISSPLGSTGWAYIKGETIQMHANVTGGSGTPHYTWQKKIDSEFEDIDGAPDDDDYEIANCTASNSGTYRCIVSTGDGCSTTSSEFDVKVYRVQILLSAATTDYDFTTIDRTEGYVQCDILLQENTDYAFKILEGHVGLGNNSATGLTSSDHDNWGMWESNANHVGLRTTFTDNYRFTWKFASASNNNTVSVTYPTHNQTADKTIYFDNSKTKWSNIYYRIGNAGHNENSGMVSKNDVTKVAGTANFYQLTTWAYNNFLAWHFADNTSWSGDKNSIYKTDGAGYVINNHTAWQKYVVSSTITLSPTTNDGGTPKVWSVEKTTGMKTYTVTSSATNCTITLEKCTDYGSGTYTALSSGGTVMPTQYVKVTVTPSTGHEWNSFSVSGTEGTDYDVVTAAAAGTPGVYIIMGDVTFTASCSVSTYDITYHDGKGMSFSGSHADGHPTTHTYGIATDLKTATKSGYMFGGWYDNNSFTGDPVTSLGATTYTDDIDLYAKWEKDVYLNLNGKWSTDGKYFAVYCWNNSSSEETWVWMELAEVCSSPAVYKATIPSNYYDRIIFVHKNSNTLATWDNKEHQSADLEFPGSKDLYTLSKEDGTGDWAGSNYSAPTYTITFAGNGNTDGSMSSISSIACDADQAITANAFTKTGYSFAGWKANVNVTIDDDEVSAGTVIADEETIQNIRSNITLTAQWSVKNYDLTWNLGGGTTTSAGTGIASGVSANTTSSIAYGTSLSAPTVTKTGYDFTAWDPSVESTMPAEAATYTATWTAKTYTISYYDSGAEDEIAFSGNHMPSYPTSHTYNSGTTTLKKASKAGYVFGGWYDNYSCEGDPVTSYGATEITSNQKLYAKWTAMNLTPLANGTLYKAGDMVPDGVEISVSSQYYPGVSANNRFNVLGVGHSNSSTGPLSSSTCSKKTIDDVDFTESLYSAQASTITSSLPTDHALQFKISHAGLLDIYCYDPVEIYLIEAEGSAVQLDASGTVKAKITKTVSAGTYYIYTDDTDNATRLYGLKFTPNYTITYNTDGADESQLANGSKTHGVNFTLSSTRYTKDGYWQTGWATERGGSQVYAFGATYTDNADLTLYPAWAVKAEYEPDLSTSAKLTAAVISDDRWMLTTGANVVSDPSAVGGDAAMNLTGDKYGLAFAPGDGSKATFDLGANTTIYKLTVQMVSGCKEAWPTIQFENEDYDDNLDEDPEWDEESAWTLKTFTYTYNEGESGWRYLNFYGYDGCYLGLHSIKIEYAPTKTYIQLDNQSATSAGTTGVIASWHATTNLTSSITTPTKTGYTFGGYYTEEDGAGTQLIDKDGAWKASKSGYTDGSKNWQYPDADLTLYAKWTEDVTTYSVIYTGTTPTTGSLPVDDTEYSGDGSETVTVEGDNSMTLTGYDFRGWSDGTTFFLPGQSFTMPTSNVTLTAVWEPNSITPITLFSTDFSDAKWSGITSICSSGSSDNEVQNGITFHSEASPAKPFTLSDGTMTWCNNNMGNKYWIAIPVTGVNGSITITVDNGSSATRFNYAIKQETSVSGSPGTGTSSTSADPSTVTISNLDKSDYVVYLGRQGSGTTTATSITITTPGVVNHFDVEFKDGETAPESHTTWPDDIIGVEKGLKILAPADGEADYYTFDDWYTTANCTTAVNYSTMTITADTKIYAKWYANTRITTQPETSVTASKDVEFTLGTGMVAVGESLTYQWYSCDENGENLVELDGEDKATMTDTKTANGTYYYKVLVSGTYGDPTYVYSNKITVTVKIAISPSLSYDNTTLYANGGTPRQAHPTLTGNTGSGTVTYSSSKTEVVTVDSETGVVTAVGTGTARVTASIAATSDYNSGSAYVDFTVPALVNQSIRVGKSTSWNGDGSAAPDMTFNDPTSSTSQVAVIANNSYTFDATATSDKDNMTAKFTSTETSKNSSKYLTLKFKNATHAIRLGEVVVPIQPVKSNGKAQVEIYEGSTLKLTSSEVTGITQGKLTNVKFTFASSYTFAANENIEVRIFFYGQTDGFRLGTPIIVNGGVLEDQKFTGSGSWSNPANWDGGSVPESYHDVVISSGKTSTITSDVTVNNITIETGATLNVSVDGEENGVTFTANSLSLKGGLNSSGTKYDMPRVYIDPASSIVRTNSTINFDISVDATHYYPIAVPFPVTVSDVDYVNSTLAGASTYGTHYVIKEYDGAGRAKNGAVDANWKVVNDGTVYGASSATLQPGTGYILTAVSIPAYGGGVIRFPMKSISDDWLDKGEQATVSAVTKNEVTVTAHTGKATEGGKNSNKGWNMLGVPYMSCFDASDASTSPSDAFIKGKLNFITGEYTDAGNVYVSVPTSDFSEYIQKPVSEAVLLPGWCFFVQVSENATVSFAAAGQEDDSSLPIYAPKREQEMPTVKTGIILSSEIASDMTTILVSDKYSAADYEINADLEKMFGNGYTLATYSLAGTTRLAYNAMSNGDAMNVIPIGYRAPADGEYTFAINPRYAENGAFEHVNLIDYETGFVTDLLVSSYTFATERTQNDERFALNVVKRQDVITDVTVTGDGLQVTGPQKVIINDKLYIIVDGKMYDAKGVMVK